MVGMFGMSKFKRNQIRWLKVGLEGSLKGKLSHHGRLSLKVEALHTFHALDPNLSVR